MAVEAAPDLCADSLRELDRHGVANLVVLARSVAMEHEPVWEPLEPGCFTDGDGPVLVWMDVLARFRVAKARDHSARDAVPRHSSVPACVILAQCPPHARWQEITGQITPILAGLD